RGKLEALLAVKQRHVRAGFENRRRRSLNAVGIAVGVGEAAAAVDLRCERVFGDADGFPRVLLVEPRLDNLGALLEGEVDGFLESNCVDLGEAGQGKKQ